MFNTSPQIIGIEVPWEWPGNGIFWRESPTKDYIRKCSYFKFTLKHIPAIVLFYLI